MRLEQKKLEASNYTFRSFGFKLLRTNNSIRKKEKQFPEEFYQNDK